MRAVGLLVLLSVVLTPPAAKVAGAQQPETTMSVMQIPLGKMGGDETIQRYLKDLPRKLYEYTWSAFTTYLKAQSILHVKILPPAKVGESYLIPGEKNQRAIEEFYEMYGNESSVFLTRFCAKYDANILLFWDRFEAEAGDATGSMYKIEFMVFDTFNMAIYPEFLSLDMKQWKRDRDKLLNQLATVIHGSINEAAETIIKQGRSEN